MSGPKISIEIELTRKIGKMEGHDKIYFGVYCGERYISGNFKPYAEYMKEKCNWNIHKSYMRLMNAFQKYVLILYVGYAYKYILKYLDIKMGIFTNDYLSMVCMEMTGAKMGNTPNVPIKYNNRMISPDSYDNRIITINDYHMIERQKETLREEVRTVFLKEIEEKKKKVAKNE